MLVSKVPDHIVNKDSEQRLINAKKLYYLLLVQVVNAITDFNKYKITLKCYQIKMP